MGAPHLGLQRRPKSLLGALALVTFVAGTAPTRAWASPAPPPASASPDERAARWLLIGNEAFKAGKFEEAEKAYEEAFALKRGYDIAGNLGATELALGKLREAAQHLAITLRLFPVTGEPALREQMVKAYDKCRQGVGAVRVEVDVRGATIFVDGVASGEAPLADEVFVEPGDHVIEAKLEGYTGRTEHVSVPKGGAVEVSLGLTPVPQPVQTITQVVTARRRSVVPGLGLAGGAALGLAVGAGFIGASGSKRSDAQGLVVQILGHRGSCVSRASNYDAARCPTLQSALHADDAFHDVAVGAFVLGSAAAVGAAAYFLWPQLAPASRQGLRLTPVVGAGTGALVAAGSF